MYEPVTSALGIPASSVLLFITILIVWETVWKFMGMWKAARNKSLVWFICLGVFNTIGILPILYLYVFSKKSKKGK
jgi:hypothetical protein